MSDQINFNDFINNLRNTINDRANEWWPHFLVFSEHVDRYYIAGAFMWLALFILTGNVSSVIDFVLFCTLLGISSIKVWKYLEFLERKSRRKPITIQPVITTSGNYPSLQKRKKYGNHLSTQDPMVETEEEDWEDTSSSKFGQVDDGEFSTIGGPQDGSRRSQRYPLSLREWSSVTSPGFTTRAVKQAELQQLLERGTTSWNRSPFQYSPDRDLQVGEVAYGSKLKLIASPNTPNNGANRLNRSQMDIISWTQNRSFTPPAYISVKPRKPEEDKFSEYVNSTSTSTTTTNTTMRRMNDVSPSRGGLGGVHNSTIIGKSNSQLVASANNIFENSKAPLNSHGSTTQSITPPPSSILEALANRKRIRDSEAGIQSPQSPVQTLQTTTKRTSIPSIFNNEDIAKGAKRVKFHSQDANAVLPPYSIPDLRPSEDEPMMATESILDQLNQTEKRYLPEDDSPPSFRQKKLKPNNVDNARNTAGTSLARKRKMVTPLGSMDDEVQEKTSKMCTCTECYDELAGTKVDQYGNSIYNNSVNGDGSRDARAKTIRKVVDQSTETEPDQQVVTRSIETAKPRVITKEQFKHDKSLRKKRLQIMLELSKEKKAKLLGPIPMTSNGFASTPSSVGANGAPQFTILGTTSMPSSVSQGNATQNATVSMLSTSATTTATPTTQPAVSSAAPAVTTTSLPVFGQPTITPNQANPIPATTVDKPSWGSASTNSSSTTEVPRTNNLASAFGVTGGANSTQSTFGNAAKASDTVIDGPMKNDANSFGGSNPMNLFQFNKPSADQAKTDTSTSDPQSSSPFTFGSGANSTANKMGTPSAPSSSEPNKLFAPSTPTNPSIAWLTKSSKPVGPVPASTSSSNTVGAFTNTVSTGNGSPFNFGSGQLTSKPDDKVKPVLPIFGGATPTTTSSASGLSNQFKFGQSSDSTTAGSSIFPQNLSNASRNIFGASGNSDDSTQGRKPQAASTPITSPNGGILGSSSNTNSETPKPLFQFGQLPATTTSKQDDKIMPLNFSTSSATNSFGAFGSASGFGTAASSTGTTSTQSGFSLGTPVKTSDPPSYAASVQNPPNSFQFGQQQNTKQESSTSSPFGIFGSDAKNGTPSLLTTPLKTNSTDLKLSQGPNAAPAFQFGQTSSGTTSKPETNFLSTVANQGNNPLTFGGSTNNSMDLPTFGSTFKSTDNTSQNGGSLPGFQPFGQSSSTSGSSQVSAPSNAFAFGATTNANAAQSSPWPTSGGDLSNQNTGSLPSSQFQFGQNQPQVSSTSGGFNFNPPGGGFSPAPPGTAPSPSPNSMFSFGSTPTTGATTPRRRITARGRKYR